MSVFQAVAGGGFVLVVSTALVQGISPPPPAALQVHSIEHNAGMVEAVRTYRGPDFIADWSVVIVSAEGKAPICVTAAGDMLHQGWSEYEQGEQKVSSMHLDEWVNDPGCFDRLTASPGVYDEYITWTPRDGRLPVTYRGQIKIK